MARIVKAVFDSQYAAKKAVDELSSFGFERDFMQIHVVKQYSHLGDNGKSSDVETKRLRSEVFIDEVKAGGHIGAGIGAAIGLSAALLVDLGALSIPVAIRGPSDIALVLLVGAIAGALFGFIFGRLLGGSIGFGFSETEAEQYASNVCPSGIRVSVFTDRSTVDSALEILNKFNPLEIQEENVSSMKPGWIGLHRSA